jgi:hypothetical protein
MNTCDKRNKDQATGIALIRAMIVIVAIILTVMVGPVAMADSSTPPQLNSTYSGGTTAANGVQIAMNIYIDSEDLYNGDLDARVFYETSPITQYGCTGAVGSNYHITLTCLNTVGGSLLLQGTVSQLNGSISGTDSVGGIWQVG